MITVKCTCGKTYQVKDSYANKKAKCTCGKVLSVPEISAEELDKQTEKISFSCCNCGKTFRVSAKFKGKKVRCKSCHTVQTVPMASESEQKDDEKSADANRQDSPIHDEDSESEGKHEKESPPAAEDSDEKIETEKTSSEKPKRLLIICLAMVLLGAIAYGLFVYYADTTSEVEPTKQSASVEAVSEKLPETVTEPNVQEESESQAIDSESITDKASEKTQIDVDDAQSLNESVTPAPEHKIEEIKPEPQKKTEQVIDKQSEISSKPEDESTHENSQTQKQTDVEENKKTENMIASVDPMTLKDDTKKYLRSTPMTYTKNQVIVMIQKFNFYEAQFNPNGGYPNRFVDNRNGTITDNETQLMWQKSGTREMVSWKKAPEYIDRLNNRKFSGYSNWRLPTLEELLTLTEPRHSRQGLYISSFFSQKQGIVGSSDSCNYDGKNLPWYISFLRGISNCISYNLIDEFHVRAVRSMDRPDKQLIN